MEKKSRTGAVSVGCSSLSNVSLSIMLSVETSHLVGRGSRMTLELDKVFRLGQPYAQLGRNASRAAIPGST